MPADNIQMFEDSSYLVTSNRRKFQEIVTKETLDENDIIDAYISLHLVLETGVNALHRQIITSQIVKPINRIEVIKNIDGIGFIEKTTLFIYNSHFHFGGNRTAAAEHHKIIGKMKNFAGIRNKLLHGHSIGSLSSSTGTVETEARSNLELTRLKKQTQLFVEICSGLKFFLEHLVIEGWSQEYIRDLETEYITTDFIPKEFLGDSATL